MKRFVIVLGLSLSCSTGLANELLIPAAARADGANGTFFRTDLRIVNLSSGTAEVEATFLPSGMDNRGALPARFTVPARQSHEVNDVLSSLFSLAGGLGAIRLASTSSIAASSRTYTMSSSAACPGSFGQSIPALSPESALTRAVLPGVRLSSVTTAGYRTNFGTVNPSQESANITVRLRNSDGTLLGTSSLQIPPAGHWQQSLQTLFNLGSVSSANAFLEVDGGSSPLYTYASVVDNQSGDSVFIVGQADPGTPRDDAILAKQWLFEPGTIEARVGQLTTLQVRAVDVDHGISFSGVGPVTCSSEQAGQCILKVGENVTVTFTPREEGSFAFFCTRFCDESADGSAGHSSMRGTLIVRR